MPLYDEIVQAMTDLGGEAKLDKLYQRMLENQPEKATTKSTVGAMLRYYSQPRRGKNLLMQSKGKGVWKLVPGEKAERKVKKEPKPTTGTTVTGRRAKVAVDDLPSFVEQIVETLKKDGGQLSITIEAIYRPKE